MYQKLLFSVNGTLFCKRPVSFEIQNTKSKRNKRKRSGSFAFSSAGGLAPLFLINLITGIHSHK